MCAVVIRSTVKALIWQSRLRQSLFSLPGGRAAALLCVRVFVPWECERWYLGIWWCCLPGCGWIFEPRRSPECESAGRKRNKHKKINETDSDSQKSDLTIKSSRWMSDVMHASEGRAAQWNTLKTREIKSTPCAQYTKIRLHNRFIYSDHHKILLWLGPETWQTTSWTSTNQSFRFLLRLAWGTWVITEDFTVHTWQERLFVCTVNTLLTSSELLLFCLTDC